MNNHLLKLTLPLCALISSGSLQADDTRLTLYPGNLALIQQQREVSLDPSGLVRIDGVPSSLRPETLSLTVNGKPATGHRLLTRTATRARLLDLHLGKDLEMVRIDPNSGRETRLDVTLIGVDGSNAIVESMHGVQVIAAGSDWSLIFPKGEHGFVHRPLLEALIPASDDGKADLHMRYLASGLGWRMDYVANLSPDNSRLDLSGWATLDNRSNQSFRDARVALIAGDIARVAKRQAPRAMAMAVMADAESGARGAPVAAQGGYHRYTLPDPVSLEAGESRQSALFGATDIPVRVRHSISSFDQGAYWRATTGSNWRAADMAVEFSNDKPALGRAMPAGSVRIYQATPDGGSLLLGEASVANVTRGEQLSLRTGKTFDVKGKRTQTAFKRRSRKEFETAWSIRVRNGGQRNTEVRVEERLPELWDMIDASREFEKIDAQTIRWTLQVPAAGEAEISYRMLVRQR